MAKNGWSYSALMMLRRCSRQYYFAQIAPSHHFTNPFRRKVFELKNSQNLFMWQGSIVDKIMENTIIPSISEKRNLDFDQFAHQAIELAKQQYEFSRLRKYKEKDISKTKVGDIYCILDIHENELDYTEEAINEIYGNISMVIKNIPKIKISSKQIPLTEYLKQASFLAPNVTGKAFKFEEIRVSPQIDLLAYINGKPVIIDWKVSRSASSDYSKQLVIIGIAILDDNRKKSKERGVPALRADDVTLFEVNLWNGETKQHRFDKEIIGETIDYIYLNSSDEHLLTEGKKFEELNVEDFPITDKPTTCHFCKFNILCKHLLMNKYQYNEAKYTQLVQA